MTFKEKIRTSPLWKKVLASLALTVAASWVVTTSLGVKFGYDDQKETCLDFKFSIVKHSPNHRFTTGEVISFDPATVAPGIFPKGQLLGKLVVGIPGDKLEVTPEGVMVNRVLLSTDFSVSVKYPPKFQSITIPPDHYFVIGTAPGSFDSRYYGLVPQSAVYGVVTPLI